MKKILIIFLLFFITFLPADAKKIKVLGEVLKEFDTETALPSDLIQFKIQKQILEMPNNSIVTAKVREFEKERRYHKAGLIVLKLESYTDENDKKIDLDENNLYFIARKYESVNAKEATITGVELVGSAAASFFVPGVDVLYFFTKGAIQRKNHKNWFKSGVSVAYENSIFWIFLKGKSIDLEEGEFVKLKEIKPEKAEKMAVKIEKRKEKKILKQNKKIEKEMKKAKKEAIELEEEISE